MCIRDSTHTHTHTIITTKTPKSFLTENVILISTVPWDKQVPESARSLLQAKARGLTIHLRQKRRGGGGASERAGQEDFKVNKTLKQRNRQEGFLTGNCYFDLLNVLGETCAGIVPPALLQAIISSLASPSHQPFTVQARKGPAISCPTPRIWEGKGATVSRRGQRWSYSLPLSGSGINGYTYSHRTQTNDVGTEALPAVWPQFAPKGPPAA